MSFGAADLARHILVELDGPNVNLKMSHVICRGNEKKINHDIPDLIDIGLCGLHVVHKALDKRIRKLHGRWISYLNLFGWLFQSTYQRRTTYKEITNSTVFPLQFCVTR